MSSYQSPPGAKQRLLKPRDAAQYLGVCEKTLYNMTKRGSLPSVREGRLVRFDIADLEQWIERRKTSNNE